MFRYVKAYGVEISLCFVSVMVEDPLKLWMGVFLKAPGSAWLKGTPTMLGGSPIWTQTHFGMTPML